MRALVLGASSFIGQHLLDMLPSGRAVGTYSSNPFPSGIKFNPLKDSVTGLIRAHGEFSHVMILFACSDPNYCYQYPRESFALNVDATKIILSEIKELAITPFFISSEFAFDGTKGNYTETDPTSPILEYGRHKVLIEQFIEGNFKKFIITRLSKTAGRSINDGTLFTNWIRRIQEGARVLECASDQHFSPIAVEDVCKAFWELIEYDANGYFHVAGPERLSRIEALKMLIGHLSPYNLGSIKITTKRIHEFNLPEKRPPDVSMSPSKLVATIGIELIRMVDYSASIVSELFGGR